MQSCYWNKKWMSECSWGLKMFPFEWILNAQMCLNRLSCRPSLWWASQTKDRNVRQEVRCRIQVTGNWKLRPPYRVNRCIIQWCQPICVWFLVLWTENAVHLIRSAEEMLLTPMEEPFGFPDAERWQSRRCITCRFCGKVSPDLSLPLAQSHGSNWFPLGNRGMIKPLGVSWAIFYS